MKMIWIFCFAVALIGCETQPRGPSRDELFAQYRGQLDASYRAGQITLVQRVTRIRDYAYQYYPRTADGDAFYAYALTLAPKVDNGTMSFSEYDYLTKKMKADIVDREGARNRQNEALRLQRDAIDAQQNSAGQPRRIDYNCQSKCISQGMVYDYCTSRCSY